MMMMGAGCLCRYIVVLCMHRIRHRMQNCSNGDTRTPAPLVRRGVKQCFTVVGQLQFVVFMSYFCHIMAVNMMYDIQRRNPKPTLLPTRGLFNLPHHIGTVREELAFDDTVHYTQQGNGFVCLLFFVLATSKVISGRVLTCDSAR